jgi:serine/threonine-protein kinase PRP4
MELDIPPSPPPINAILAARRAKRQAILAKYSGAADADHSLVSGLSSAAQPPTLVASVDRREDERRRVRYAPVDDYTEVTKAEEEEDVDDMFAIATVEKNVKAKKVVCGVYRVWILVDLRRPQQNRAAPALITTTLDSAADSEGYYSVILGEQLDGGRYQVFSSLGKGMFANVVRARVLQGEVAEVGKEVAIKIVRCQESMFVYAARYPGLSYRTNLFGIDRYRAGLKEVQILTKLRQADPDDKKHIVRLERTFEHRGHLCLVFESMRSASPIGTLQSVLIGML